MAAAYLMLVDMLCSIVCLGAEDDDANAAVKPIANLDEEKNKAFRDFNVCKSITDVTAVWNKLPAHIRAIAEVVEACKSKGESFKVSNEPKTK